MRPDFSTLPCLQHSKRPKVLLVCNGQHKVYVTTLILLLASVILHFGANWVVIRATFISHNETGKDIAQQSTDYQNLATFCANTGAIGAIWIGDSLLVCIFSYAVSTPLITAALEKLHLLGSEQSATYFLHCPNAWSSR